MIKLIGFSALAFGFIEWIYDFKMNGWSFATVLSFVYLVERLHHNHQMRSMLYQIGDKVGVEWQSYLPENGLQNIYPKLLKYLTKLKEKRTRTMNPQNINYATLIPTLLAAIKIVLQGFGIDIPDEHINLAVNIAAGIGTLIGVYLPHTKAAEVSEAFVKIAPGIMTTFKQAIPMLTAVHADINKLLENVKKDDGSQLYTLSMQAYLDIERVLETYKVPEPLPAIEKVAS